MMIYASHIYDSIPIGHLQFDVCCVVPIVHQLSARWYFSVSGEGVICSP